VAVKHSVTSCGQLLVVDGWQSPGKASDEGINSRSLNQISIARQTSHYCISSNCLNQISIARQTSQYCLSSNCLNKQSTPYQPLLLYPSMHSPCFCRHFGHRVGLMHHADLRPHSPVELCGKVFVPDSGGAKCDAAHGDSLQARARTRSSAAER
jgi:hypothetical protein